MSASNLDPYQAHAALGSFGQRVNPHKTLDPTTGACLDCGATREEIDDRLFEICEKVTGPNRLTILGARRQLHHFERQEREHRARLRALEEMIPSLQQLIREDADNQRELRASIAVLEGVSEPKLSVAEAINRT